MEEIKLNDNESIKEDKAKSELKEAKRKCWEAFKELMFGIMLLLMGGFVTMFSWNVVATWFGFKCVSYVVGLCGYMLCRVLLKRE